jgi:hypothetical protein
MMNTCAICQTAFNNYGLGAEHHERAWHRIAAALDRVVPAVLGIDKSIHDVEKWCFLDYESDIMPADVSL